MAEDESTLPTSEVIRSGANLPQEDWNEARIAAARKMLPTGFRDPANMIAYLARAQRSGLDPFSGELHAWEEKGELTFMTSRDGFIKVLRRDESVDGVEVGAVFENDSFQWEKDREGNISVEHAGGIQRGELVGAYCVIHVVDGEDHIETRLLEDFEHLLYKDNWKNYPIDMLQTRCVSAAARFVTTATAGIYTEADMELRETGQRTSAHVRSKAEEQTDDLAERLEAEREGSYEDAEPIEASVVEEDEGEGEAQVTHSEEPEEAPAHEPHDTTGDGRSDMVDGRAGQAMEEPPEEEEEEPEPEEGGDLEDARSFPCRICGKEFDSGPSRGGHQSGHTKRGETLPEGWRVEKVDKAGTPKYMLYDPEGHVRGETDGFAHWKKALAWVDEEVLGGDEQTLDAVVTEFEGASSGELIQAIYQEIQNFDDPHEGQEVARELAADLSGDDVEGSGLSHLPRPERLKLILKLRQRNS